jgi:hypothetical protein
MADGGDNARDAIHDAIQHHAPLGSEALLTGWVLVAEWMDPHGERWLSKAHAASTSDWAAKGMHHEALHGKWPDRDDT